MTEQEISQQMQQIQAALSKTIIEMDGTAPAAILIAACMNIVGTIADAGKLHQQAAGLMRDCAERLEASSQAAASVSVH